MIPYWLDVLIPLIPGCIFGSAAGFTFVNAVYSEDGKFRIDFKELVWCAGFSALFAGCFVQYLEVLNHGY